jgi:CheY-like chemotaxis protein
VAVSRGKDALSMARRLRPSAITLDVMMPGLDGWSVMSALKGDPLTADIPIVMLTIVDDANLGFTLGASEYLTKPLDRQRLLEVLKRYCRPGARGRALVVEDDADSRELFRRMLEKDDWEVIEAANGREALECVGNAKLRPALIVLDLMMPEMDGFEFLNELRRHPEWQNIPVIVVTARDLSEEDRMVLNGSLLLSGSVKRVFQKGSFDRDDLLREVRSLVHQASGAGH